MKLILSIALLTTLASAEPPRYNPLALPSRPVLETAGNYHWKAANGEEGDLELTLSPKAVVKTGGKTHDATWKPEGSLAKVQWDGGKQWLSLPMQAAVHEIEGSNHKGSVKLDRKAWNAAGVRLVGQSSGGKSHNKNWVLPWGSYNEDIVSSRGIMFSLTTVGRVPSVVKLEWGWIGRDAKGLFVRRGGDDFVHVMQGFTVPFYTPAGEFKENHTLLVALGLEFRDGEKYRGWVARLRDEDGRVAATASSTSGYANLVETDW